MGFQAKQEHCCTFCDFKCTVKSKLEYHVRQHTGERPFFCDQCNRGFSLKPSLKLHIMRVHHKIKPVYEKKYKCSLCPYATHKRHTLDTHTQRHIIGRSFACQKLNCKYAAKSSRELQLHITWKHSEERKYLCQFPNCSYRGKTHVVLKQHHLSHSESKPFVCDVPECNYRFKRKYSLKKHQLGVHNGGHKPFACSKCNHRTTCKPMLNMHELTHSQEKSFKCSVSECTFSCKTKKLLNYHVENRHTERTFTCDFVGCLSTAASRSKLDLHKRLVHHEKVYQCPKCDYRAALPSILRKHIVHHNVRQRIPCPINGCMFKAKSRQCLDKHMRYHKSNVACPVEGCVFISSSKSSWKRHMQLHDPSGRPLHCPLCPKLYATNQRLLRHLRSHTQEKPFKCPACNFASAYKSLMKNHVRKTHSTLSTQFICDDKYFCNHCGVNFGNAFGLAMHTVELKTAVVVLTRLQLKYDD